MIGHLLKRYTTLSTQTSIRNLFIKPSYKFGQGNPFHFYSFEEEIHKLKLAQDQLKNKQPQLQQQQQQQQQQNAITGGVFTVDRVVTGSNPQLKSFIRKSIEELNRLYREANIFNFEIIDDYVVKSDSKEFKQLIKQTEYLKQQEQYKITQSLWIVEQILSNKNREGIEEQQKYSHHEQSLVLETFFHNVLLSILCEQQQLYKQMHQRQVLGPLIDEMYILSQFLQTFVANSHSNLEIVSGNPSLFKYIVKTFEILKIQQNIAIPFIQKYLNETIDDSHHQTLHDISVLLLPISDYIFECGYYTQQLGQPNNSQILDLSSLSLKIRRLLKDSKETNSKKQNRDEVSTLCKTLFCMVRINGGRGKVCLDLAEALLGSNYESLTEIEMTSIIYSITKLSYDRESEVLFERKIKREMPNLIFDYETKIEKMLQTRYFHQARVPYILYCLQNSSKYRPAYRRNQINYICQSLISIVMKNYEKYKASEITTIIYSLKMINNGFQSDIETLYRSYFLKLALDQQKRDSQKQQQHSQKSQLPKQNDSTLTNDLVQDNQEDEDFLNNHMNKEFLTQSTIEGVKTKQNQINNQEKGKVQTQNDKINISINSNNQQKQVKSQQSIGNNAVTMQQKSQGFNIKMQKVRNTIVYFEQLQAVDILCLFIGIRNNEKHSNNNPNNTNNNISSYNNNKNNQHLHYNNNSQQTEKLNSIFVINQQLFQLFLTKQQNITNNLKIKILYEVSYNHSELLDSYLFEKYYKDWIVTVSDSLHSLNNHDLIALGYIMKKFARLFAYHIDFWIKFTEESNKRTYHNPVENQRIRVVILNMSNFYHKCLNSPPSLQKQEKNRIKRLQTVYDLMQQALQKLNQVESNKQYDSQNEEFDFDSEQFI